MFLYEVFLINWDSLLCMSVVDLDFIKSTAGKAVSEEFTMILSVYISLILVGRIWNFV